MAARFGLNREGEKRIIPILQSRGMLDFVMPILFGIAIPCENRS